MGCRLVQIAESFKTFGLQPDTTAVLVARFDPKPEEVLETCSLPQPHNTPLHPESTPVNIALGCGLHLLASFGQIRTTSTQRKTCLCMVD